MIRRLMSKVAVFTLAAMLGGAAFAQSTTQGSIAGTVEDATGAAIPAASVTIHNDGTNAEQHFTADSSGFFKDSLLEPGTYTVTIAAPSFEAYRAKQVVVQVGQTTNLMPQLKIGEASQVVEVSTAVPVLNFESPDFTTNINQVALENIPINNRRWSALALITPGVVSDSNGFGLVSVRGISPILNNILIDGADDNQAYYAEERGRTREAYSTSSGAVREFAVNTGVYGAEYGRAAGAVINSVTKSGTNQLHGDVYFYDRQSKWNAYNDFTKITSVTANSTGGFAIGGQIPIKPEDLRKIYGFTVGGALIKDRLFWEYTFDEHHRIFPGTAVPTSPGTFYTLPSALPATATCAATGNGYYTDTNTGADATQSSINAQTCLLAARQGISYAAASTLWTNNIVDLNSDLGSVPRFGNQEINTPKIDWRINNKETVSFLYHRLRWDSPGGVQTQTSNNYAVDSFGNDYVKLDYGLSKLTSIITNNISNELLYQYSRELDDETQQPYSPYTTNNLCANGNCVQVGLATSIFVNMGSEYYAYRKALPDERKWQIGDVLHWQHGNHNLTAGGDILRNADLINNTYESNGSYSYSYLGNYMNDLANEKAGKVGTCGSQTGQNPTTADTTVTAGMNWTGNLQCYGSFYQGFGNPIFGIATTDWSAFVQDNWKMSPRLTLELGVRYDYEFLPAPITSLITPTTGFNPYPQLANHPSDKNNAGARIGFSYDPFGTGKTVVRGGYGMFYGRITNGVLLNVLLNTGSPNGQYTTTIKPTYTGAPTLPNIVAGASAPAPSSYFLAKNLQDPMVHEFDLMVQQEIGRGTVFQISYLGALGRELPNFLDLNLDPTTVQNVNVTLQSYSNNGQYAGKCGPLGACGTAFAVPTYTKYGNASIFPSNGTFAATQYQSITQVTSNVNSNYHAFVAEIQNRSLKSIEFDFNYVWSHALDYNQQATTTNTGNSWYDPYGSPRTNYGNSAYNVPNRFTGYAIYHAPGLHSNAWYTYLSNGWSIDTSFQMQSGLPWTVGATGYTEGVVSDWNGSGGTPLIPLIGLNTMKYPRKIVDDLRLEKDFKLYKNYNLQLLAQMFNVANHQNVDGINTTAYKLGGSGTAGTATFQAPTYNTVTSSNNSGFLYTPRDIEIAAKLSF
jgi:hypothetical protein